MNAGYILHGTGGLSTAQLANILAVSEQCPFAGGPAVYMARSVRYALGDTAGYNDKLACLQQGLYKKANNQSPKNSITIVPNPAWNNAEIIFEGKYEGFCYLKLINMLGTTVLEKQVDCTLKSHVIDTRSFSPGIYVVKLYFDQSAPVMNKLIIAK
jgi:hypothetical protein